MSENTDISFVKTVADLAKTAGSELATITLNEAMPGLPTSIPILIDKQKGSMAGVAGLFEPHRTHPARKAGTAKVTTLESFVDLVNRHKTEDSVIFADTNWQSPSLTAVIDYHVAENGGEARYGKHRIHYAFPLSEEWRAWIAQNGEKMRQADFAQWIEDHIAELVAPNARETAYNEETFGFKTAPPNELQQLSRGLQIKVETRIKSSVTLQSGEGEIIWEEEHRDNMGNRLVVPGMFMLSIAPFFMGDVCRIPVRLRYKAAGGAAVWSFHLYRPDIYITNQINAALTDAVEKVALPAYQGAPEMTA
jgi:uncharacterized protein YfdQ (DUF2303 family)